MDRGTGACDGETGTGDADGETGTTGVCDGETGPFGRPSAGSREPVPRDGNSLAGT